MDSVGVVGDGRWRRGVGGGANWWKELEDEKQEEEEEMQEMVRRLRMRRRVRRRSR